MKISEKWIVAAAGFVVAAAGAVANAQTFTLDWKVNGLNQVSVNPGDVVTVTGVGSWSPAVPLPGAGLGGTMFQVQLFGADASDSLNYSEAGGFGRALPLRFTPQTLMDMPMGPAGRSITASTGVVDAFQMPMFFNPLFDAGNPITVFSFQLTAGTAGRQIDIGSLLLSSTIYTDMAGTPGNHAPSVDGARVNVVPTPGAAALIGISGLLAARRRRD